MEDWELKNEILDCIEADDEEYDSANLMFALGYTNALLEEADI